MASFGKPSRRGSLVRISQVLLGVFVLTTCGQDTATGPGGQVNGFIDATALLRAGGQVPIPITEVFVELRRTSDSSSRFQPASHRQRNQSERDLALGTNPGRSAPVAGGFLSRTAGAAAAVSPTTRCAAP